MPTFAISFCAAPSFITWPYGCVHQVTRAVWLQSLRLSTVTVTVTVPALRMQHHHLSDRASECKMMLLLAGVCCGDSRVGIVARFFLVVLIPLLLQGNTAL